MTNDLAGKGQTPYGAVTYGIQAYFAKVTVEDDGVCGRGVSLATLDDTYSAELALIQTRNLVEQQQVLGMVGALSTEGHKEVARYLTDPNNDGNTSDGVPDLFISTGWSGYTDEKAYPWTVGFIPDYDTDGRVLARIADSGLADDETPALLYTDDQAGQDYLAAARAVFGDGLLAAPISTVNPDPLPKTRELQEKGADAVILASPPEISAMAIETAEAIDYEPRWLLAYGNAPSALASDLGGGTNADQLLTGFGMLDGALSTAFLLSPVEHADDPAMIEHSRIMATYDGTPVSSLTVYGQSVAEALVEALSRTCHNLTRAGILSAAESLTGYRTSLMLPGIEVSLAADDHRAVEGLQPIEIHADGRVLPAGDVVDAEGAPDSTP